MGLPRKTACNVVETAQRKSQPFAFHNLEVTMSNGEPSNEAPISQEEWRRFNGVVYKAIRRATNTAGDVSKIPFIYQWRTEHGFEPYIQEWDDNRLSPNERPKGVSGRLNVKKVLVYTGEWKSGRRECLDMTGKSGPWNAKLRDMVAQIEGNLNDRRNRAANPYREH
jgi:hypothetical protein